LKFEREVRLILTALRSKFLKKDITFELQFEDPTDSFVNYILVQKDAESFTPPQEYQSLNAIFKKYYQDPIIFHRHLLQYRFEKVEEMIEGKSFAIDEILVYMIKLILIEDWNYLNKNKGKEIIDSLI
jgi:hypothetical protein